MKTFTKESLPPDTEFSLFRKTGLLKATRINGPFTVTNSQGTVTEQDGWLAIDQTTGEPYAIPHVAHRETYEPAAGVKV